MGAISAYEAFVQSADRATQAAFFGLKREEDIARYAGHTLLGQPAQKALIRYTGVVFEALDYGGLEGEAQRWCDENILLFSNLFGPVLGKEALPDYRFKQGAQLPGLDSGAYEQSFHGVLEAFLADECVLDLRAGWYIKRYPVARSIVPVFLKNGRVLSHWAKTQRGKLTRFLATHRPESQSDLADLNPPGLTLLEIRQHGAHERWIFETAGP
jgi:cytoplasmic iron level regulating protein YaaA (DUF328/UPF0246 family)